MLGFRKHFSDLHPVCYKISIRKEIIKRHLLNFFRRENWAESKSEAPLPALIASFQNHLIKRAPGVDLTTQINKVENIRLASSAIHGILIRPGETFSFWHTVGNTTKRKGYKEGRIINGKGLVTGMGGGLCNLGNCLNRIVLQSPLKVTEFHKHSDSLAPDEGERIPLAAGTSVGYNYVDYRFQNHTEQCYQLRCWVEGEEFFCELRAEKAVPYQYRFEEQGRHYRKEGKEFYHYSKLYLITSDLEGKEIRRELIWDNRSKVMYAHELIPKDLIQE